MGGDDLGDDEDYITTTEKDVTTDWSTQHDNKRPLEPQPYLEEDPDANQRKQKKKQKKLINLFLQKEDEEDGTPPDPDVHHKHSQTQKQKKKFLIEAGRGMQYQPAQVQASFLWTCYTHFFGSMKEEEIGRKFQPKVFAPPRNKEVDEKRGREMEGSMAGCIRNLGGISFKRIKSWPQTKPNKPNKSPLVLILCTSARRCVQLLKTDLAPYIKVRMAKWFAKHLPVGEQRRDIAESDRFGVAVGTPGRVLALMEGEGGRVLSLDGTELIVLDCYEDAKRFTVCTLNETAADVMRLLRYHVQSQLAARDDLKLALW